MIRVKFKKSYEMYNAGDVAGFQPTIAQKIIAAGWADPIDVPAPKHAVVEVEVKETTTTEIPKRKFLGVRK